jgi:hypothetical protein
MDLEMDRVPSEDRVRERPDEEEAPVKSVHSFVAMTMTDEQTGKSGYYPRRSSERQEDVWEHLGYIAEIQEG